MTILIPLALILTVAGAVWRPATRPPPALLGALPQGERVLAVLRPDGGVVITLAALGVALLGLAVAACCLAFGSDGSVPAVLGLAVAAVPVTAEWAAIWRRTWVLTDRRLLMGQGLEVALADLTRIRILPLGLEVEARGARRLRLDALRGAAGAAQAIRAAALARQAGQAPAADSFPRAQPGL